MTKKLAFLEKVFLDKRSKTEFLRGVELFNLKLIKDFCNQGVETHLCAEQSWEQTIKNYFGEQPNLKVHYVKHKVHAVITGVKAGLALIKESPFDVLLIGNVANRLILALKILKFNKAFGKMVLVAHREVSARFINTIKKMPGNVVAVSEGVARGFRNKKMCSDIAVDYGIMNAELFYPRSDAENKNGKIKLCVLGALDNKWKGADTAIAAVRGLSGDINEKIELHLMSYFTPPEFSEEKNIFAYKWIDASKMPEVLREMDIMLVPSRDENVMRETFSQTCVQGMLTELPIIHSTIPVLVEKFDEGGGICCETVSDFSSAIESLVVNNELRKKLGKEARATALKRYVWDSERFIQRYF